MTRLNTQQIAFAALCTTIAFATACTDGSTSPATVVRDSAGVRIVTTTPVGLESLEGWSLERSPNAEIGGGANPEVPLHQITDVQPLGDGRVAVATSNPPQGLVFSADGIPAATLGGAGDGPGEFADVGAVVPIAGDSLAVWDPHRRRISVFSAEGVFVRDVDVADVVPQSPQAAGSTLVPAAVTSLLPAASGTLALVVAAVWGPGVPESGAYRLEMPSHRIDASGTSLATYGPFPGLALFKSEVGEIPLPFGAGLHAATSGSSLVVGTAEEPELSFYTAEGTLEQLVRWPVAARSVAASELAAEFNSWLDGQFAQRDPSEQILFRGLIDGIPRPELFPAYGGIISGEGRQIWVGDYPGQLSLMGLVPDVRRVPAREWLVFEPDGVPVAAVRTPTGFQPYAVRDGRVWGVYTDELDVESVRAYTLVK